MIAESSENGFQKLKLVPQSRARDCTAMATLSSTVRRVKMLVIWYERASPSVTRSCIGRLTRSAPSNTTWPPLSGKAPERT